MEFISVLYTNSCARSYRLITHARHAKYPRTGFRSHHSAWPATPRSCGVHWSRCRLIGSDRGPGEPPSTVWYRDSSPRLKLARASRRHANLGPMRAPRRGAESVVEGAVEGSARIWSAGTGTFEHWEADPAPCGARAVAQSTWRDAQPTRLSKNRCPAHSLGRAEVIRASTCRTLSTRQVGRYVGLWALGS